LFLLVFLLACQVAQKNGHAREEMGKLELPSSCQMPPMPASFAELLDVHFFCRSADGVPGYSRILRGGFDLCGRAFGVCEKVREEPLGLIKLWQLAVLIAFGFREQL
jgi:hypothetical protein